MSAGFETMEMLRNVVAVCVLCQEVAKT